MALPQGINFRETVAFATDSSPNSGEAPNSTTFPESYPRTTAEGNTVGWVTSAGTGNARDRAAGNDNRIRGHHFHTDNGYYFRIDLPSAGVYSVRLASGDGNYTTTTRVDLYDSTTSLVTLCNGTTSAANRFFDANGTEHTAANWPANNTSRSATFSTTQLRLYNGGGGANTVLSHFYVEASGPTITDEPDDVATYPGLTAQFSVTATGSGSLTYQWQRATSGTAYTNVSGGSGGTTATYTTPTLGFDEHNYTYRCQVTDSGGTTNSRAARLTLTPNSSIAWIRQ